MSTPTPFDTWWARHTADAKVAHSDAVAAWQAAGCVGDCPRPPIGPEIKSVAEQAWDAATVRMTVMRQGRADGSGHRRSGPKVILAWFIKHRPLTAMWADVADGTGMSEVVTRTVLSRLTRKGVLERVESGFYSLSSTFKPDVNQDLLTPDPVPPSEPPL